MKNILSMKYIVPAILVSFVMMSCGQENTPSTQMDKTPPVPVEVKNTTQVSQSSFLVASGKIEATDKSRITTRMMGYIENIYVKVGSKVKKGQLLVKPIIGRIFLEPPANMSRVDFLEQLAIPFAVDLPVHRGMTHYRCMDHALQDE